jgi:HEAT repeat protein
MTMKKRVSMAGAGALLLATSSLGWAQAKASEYGHAWKVAQQAYAHAGAQEVHAFALAGQAYALAEARYAVERTALALPMAEHAVRRARAVVPGAYSSTYGARVAYREALRLERGAIEAAPREAWLQEDPGDSLYRAGREALNRRDYREAARLFQELSEVHGESGYAADALYYQAFALYRSGRPAELEESLTVLERLSAEYPDAATRGDAEQLIVRVEGEMARRGDAGSTRRLMDQASGSCQGQDYELRAMALSALMNMDTEQAVPILKEVLQDRENCPELREQAVFLLSQHVMDETVELFLDLAHRDPDPDPEVRNQAVFWLSQVDHPEAVDALESILQSSTDQEIQESALFALSQHQSERAIGILRGYAERSDAPEELRANAIFWLSQNSDLGSAYLIGLWDSVQAPELREQILFGMSQIEDPEATGWLLDRARDASLDMELRKNALFWAAQRDLDVSELMSLYDSMDRREMREQILFGLSQMDSPEAVDALMEIARSDPDPEIQENAIFWLGQSDDPRVAEFLLELIRR